LSFGVLRALGMGILHRDLGQDLEGLSRRMELLFHQRISQVDQNLDAR
jgi:hypothetical protein